MFSLAAFHYVFKIGPRLLNAPVFRFYPKGEFHDQKYDRVFVSWDAEKNKPFDQYILWIGQQSGMTEAVSYTVRDNDLPGAGGFYASIYFSDFKEVGGTNVPHLQTVKLAGPNGKTSGGYVHQLTVEQFIYDAFSPSQIRPNIDLVPIDDRKRAEGQE